MRRGIFLLMLSFSTVAYADATPVPTQDFVEKVAVTNQFEVGTSELALRYSNAPDLRSFALQLIDDHTRADEEFRRSLAEAKIDPPADIDISQTASFAKLRTFAKKVGFDAAYIATQLEAHQEAVALFSDYAVNGTTPEVKIFAANVLPILERHLTILKELQAAVPKS